MQKQKQKQQQQKTNKKQKTTFFSSAHGTFSRIDHILEHKTKQI